MNWSARGYSRILKTARTIADLEESDAIKVKHLQEALGYRMDNRKYTVYEDKMKTEVKRTVEAK